MRVFTPKYTDKRTGKIRKSPNYHVEFTDHMGVRRRVVGFPTSAGMARSTSLAGKLERLSASQAAHDPVPADLRVFVQNMPPKLLAKLAQ